LPFQKFVQKLHGQTQKVKFHYCFQFSSSGGQLNLCWQLLIYLLFMLLRSSCHQVNFKQLKSFGNGFYFVYLPTFRPGRLPPGSGFSRLACTLLITRATKSQ